MPTVLIADDEDLSRYALRKMVSALAPSLVVVAEAENGREAVSLAERFGPDLVLMDIRMPGLDGLAAAETILALKPLTRIVITSAHDDFAYAQKAVNLRLSGYLLKPVREEDFLAVVAPLLATLEQVSGASAPVPPRPSADPHENLYARACAYLAAVDLSQVTLESTADALGVSPPHLSRTFKALSGQLFVEYLTSLRMEAAKDALASEEAAVEEIGRRLGYRDGGYFARVFKAAVGLSPGEFRRSARRGARYT
jgi:YesN/AraC family two-component response regulator